MMRGTEREARPDSVDESPLLEVSHVVRRFGRGEGSRTALRGVSMRVDKGRCLAVIGGSGSGKTTLAHLLLGLQRADAGAVRYRGALVQGRRSPGYRLLRGESSVVFQNPYASLDPRWDVERLVAEPLMVRLHGKRIDADDRRDMVVGALTQAGLDPASVWGRRPARLSGGQAQRVAIARAIVTQPKLIVADEPMSAIDVAARLQVVHTFAAIRDARPDAAIVIVSHDLGVVQHLADDVLVLHDGTVVEQGPTDRILQDPQHPYTRELVRAASW